jgi:hypothetical protein
VWHYYYDSVKDEVGEYWAEYQDYLDKNHNKVTEDADPMKEGLVPAVHEGDR